MGVLFIVARRKEITVKNHFREVAKFLNNDNGTPALAISTALAFVLGLTAGVTYEEKYVEKNDNIGTVENQQQLVAKFSERIEGMKKQKMEVKKIEAAAEVAGKFNTELSPEEQKELEQLKEAFISTKKSILTDMHVTGISEEGVGLSEKNFAKLYSDILRIVDTEIVKIKDTDFTSKISRATGMLDETAVELFKTGNIKDKYSVAVAINKELKKISDDNGLKALASLLTGAVGGGLGAIMLLSAFIRRVENSPEELKIRLGKKHLPTSH